MALFRNNHTQLSDLERSRRKWLLVRSNLGRFFDSWGLVHHVNCTSDARTAWVEFVQEGLIQKQHTRGFFDLCVRSAGVNGVLYAFGVDFLEATHPGRKFCVTERLGMAASFAAVNDDKHTYTISGGFNSLHITRASHG
jgi:hypothetical protein